MKQRIKPRLAIDDYVNGVLQGNRVMLAQAITLTESTLPADQQLAAALIERTIHASGNAIRIGITGAPGVGKSTFIEALGKYITAQGKKIAVLTIDPTSPLTKGSILGDKTRMEELAKNPLAFIRPSSSGTTLGGVAYKTREAMLLCEAAGFEVIIIETVGVGQSEVAVKNMVDFFLLLMLPGAGDELQGIKKGIMEMADALVITKADGDNIKAASKAKADYQHALHLFPPAESGWTPTVLTASAIAHKGIEETWQLIASFQDQVKHSGYFDQNRRKQNITWMHEYFYTLLTHDLHSAAPLQEKVRDLEQKVSAQQMPPYAAAKALLETYHQFILEANPETKKKHSNP